MPRSTSCFQKFLLNLLGLISLITDVGCLLPTNTIKNFGRTGHSQYVSNIYAKKSGEGASSSTNKSSKRITSTSADKGLGDKLNPKDITVREEKLVDVTAVSKALPLDNKKKSVAVKTEGTEYIDNLKVKKIRCENTFTLLSNLEQLVRFVYVIVIILLIIFY